MPGLHEHVVDRTYFFFAAFLAAFLGAAFLVAFLGAAFLVAFFAAFFAMVDGFGPKLSPFDRIFDHG
jgi:hypothetical protein